VEPEPKKSRKQKKKEVIETPVAIEENNEDEVQE